MSYRRKVEALHYGEPYHHYVSLPGGVHRVLGFGLEYLNYMQSVLDLVEQEKPRELLDFGCGDGKLLLEVSRRLGPRTGLTGIDLDERSIGFAQAYLPGHALHCRDIRSLAATWEESFDLVTSVETLEHISDTDTPSVVEAVWRVLKPKGKLIVSVPSCNVPLQAQHYRHYTDERLARALCPPFALTQLSWIHCRHLAEKIVRNLIINRWFLLRRNRLQRMLVELYRRVTQHATPNNGKHIVAVLRK